MFLLWDCEEPKMLSLKWLLVDQESYRADATFRKINLVIIPKKY
jgi:hypothetical protein